LADFDKAIALDEKYAWAIRSREQVHLSLKRYEDALSDFSHAIELDPKNDWVFYLRGLLYLVRDEAEKSTDDFAQAIQLAEREAQQHPNDWQNRLNLALYLLATGQSEAAQAHYAAAIDASISVYLLQPAIDDLDDFLQVIPDQPQALQMRAILAEHVLAIQ